MTQGTLGPKQKKEIQISFKTTEAKVIIASIVVRVMATAPGAASEGQAAELQKVLKMSAIGKYPFVTLDNLSFDFENLLVGKTASQVFNLQNSSLVPTRYTIERVNDDGKDNAIQVDHTSGELQPGQITKVTVTYTPQLAEVKSYCLFKVSAFGGNEIEFSCRGKADGYNIELSSKTVQFGEVQAQQTTNRLLNVVNDSDLPTSFQFFTDKSNLFSISMTEGVVKAHASQRIIITFSPQRTGNYYERIFCLVRNHKVLFVDLLGTCYDVLTKPVPLSQRHIDTYRVKVIMGAHRKVQQASKDMEAACEDSLMDSGYDYDLHLEKPIDDGSNQVILHKEMLQSSSAVSRDLRLSDESINFNFTENGRISESRQLTLENKFGFPISVDWTLLPVLNKTTGQMVKNPFKVLPAQKEIGPNSVFVFNVDFAPYEPDSYFFQMAQCFVTLQNGNHNKMKQLMAAGQTLGSSAAGAATMRSQKASTKGAGKTLLGTAKQAKYTDWSLEEIDPPQCLSVRLSGHSFAPGSQPFIPMVKISSNKIAFPPCSPNESVYQTIQLNNTSDTPVQYSIMQDTTGTFKSFPSIGQISGKSFQLICLEFNPKSPRFFNFSAQFLFNNSSANMQQVLLQGFCYGPTVTLQNQQLFFPPSYVGVSTKQKFPIRNESRIPVEYVWTVPKKYANEISFDPPTAQLAPNEASIVTAVFTPLKRKEYQVSIPLYTKNLFKPMNNMIGYFSPGSGKEYGQQNNAAQSQISTVQQTAQSSKFIEIVGAGADGMISISPENLDFGTITVGYTKTLSVMISNKSNCNLYIELKMMQTQRDEDATSGEAKNVQSILNSCFKFDNHKGIVNAKSKKKVNITFKPSLRFQFETSLVCIATEKMSKDLAQTVKGSIAPGRKPLQGHVEKAQIKIHCKGDYPLLRFTDVRNDQVSIANLWERFELTKMNKELLQPLSQAEQDFNNSDQINGSNEEIINNLQRFSWDFGKLPIKNGSKPRKITLSLKNVGGVQADWNFKMPNDSEIQMESWADPGTPSQEQAFEKEILDKQIFEIEPRRGSLAPGEQMDLHVLYYPKEVRKHHLSIFFQIMNGKPLAIRFEGETLHRRAQLQLIKHTYDLPPVPIGLEWAITYPIEIKNLGITKLKYQIDMSRMEKLNQDNHDFRVFEISNPEGTLRSNEISHIFTLFRPLEAKKYALDLPIKISDIEGPSVEPYTLRLRGTGYHLEQEKPDEVQFYEDLPVCRAHLNDDGSMAAFSTESIDFGEIAHEEPSRRFVILYNLNPTQKLKFDFQKTRLICGDELFLEPMSGELKPNSHCNIKMTLLPGKYPCNFEGEIQCSIDWENEDRRALDEARSVATNTNVPEVSEYLFIRLKKRAKITKMHLGADLREGESLIENIVNEAMHDILESDEFDRLLDESNKAKAGIYERSITNEAAPAEEDLAMAEERKGQSQNEQVSSTSRRGEAYEDQLMEVSGVNAEELFRKRMYMQKPFVDLMEFILEDTLFNLMEEATYDEFDLGQPPRIYIRKDE